MKRVTRIILSCLLLVCCPLQFILAVSDTASATDTVTTTFTSEERLLLLAVEQVPGFSLSASENYSSVTAGGEPVLTLQASEVTTGAFLQYSLAGYTTATISASAVDTTYPYTPNSLGVTVSSFTAGGSVNDAQQLGMKTAPADDGDSDDTVTLLPAAGTAKTIITDIDGSSTWTGTNSGNGAVVKYKLCSEPAADHVEVVYTITANYNA